MIYDYYLDELGPCLDAAGYEVGEIPTWETFRGTYEADPWSPYDVMMSDGPTSMYQWLEINEQCPQGPPLEDLYGPDP